MPKTSKKQTDLDPTLCREALAVCACSNLRAATRAVTKLFDDALAPVGLRATQLVILLAIAERKGQTIAEVANRLQLDASTLNRNLNVLRSRGLVIAKPLHGNRKQLSLSSKGTRSVNKAVPIWERIQSGLVERFGKKRFRELLTDLNDLSAIATSR